MSRLEHCEQGGLELLQPGGGNQQRPDYTSQYTLNVCQEVTDMSSYGTELFIQTRLPFKSKVFFVNQQIGPVSGLVASVLTDSTDHGKSSIIKY